LYYPSSSKKSWEIKICYGIIYNLLYILAVLYWLMTKNKNQIYISTDGSYHPDTDRGGWASIIKYNGVEKVVQGHSRHTTCQRMEATGLTIVLPQLLEAGFREFHISTDSMYCIWALRGWRNWLRKTTNWPNQDLWRPLFQLLEKYNPSFELQWVPGHSGHSYNEACDEMAGQQSI